jgi:hypothetical protein
MAPTKTKTIKGQKITLEKPEEQTESKFYKFFNFKKVADAAGIQPDKLYNNFKGFYASMQTDDKDSVAKVLIPQVKALFKYLGYNVAIQKDA